MKRNARKNMWSMMAIHILAVTDMVCFIAKSIFFRNRMRCRWSMHLLVRRWQDMNCLPTL